MMKKRVCTLLLALSLVVAVFAGCNSQSPSDGGSVADGGDGTAGAGSGAEAPAQSAPAEGGTLSLLSPDTTKQGWDELLEKMQAATGITLDVIAAPTDTNTRQQKITTILSSGDDSVDLIQINDEMAASFRDTGWLEPLQDRIMTPEVLGYFPKDYIADMVTSKDGDIVTVPYQYQILALFIDQRKLDELGMDTPTTKDEYLNFLIAATKDGEYGYAGAWEKTYVFNEIASFVNLFGGDYYDWTNPKNREALQFLYDLVNVHQVTPIAQLAEKYEQMNQRMIDGKAASCFVWGSGTDYRNAGRYGDEDLHIIPIPQFETKSAFVSSWGYCLNRASGNKELAFQFLEYAASKEGSLDGWHTVGRYPARTDAVEDPSFENDIKEIYQVYYETTELRGRPMLPQAMEFISEVGTIFQQYVQDEIDLDTFCEKAQQYVETYSK